MRTNKKTDERVFLNAALRAIWLAAALLLTGCGGSSGGGGPQPQSASLSYPSSALMFTVGIAITPVAPTVTGPLSSFTVSPTLPAGLSLSTNGTLTGTPNAASPTTTYTATGSGSGASASATLSITVNNTPPASLSYGSPAFTFTTGIAARMLIPTTSGGIASGWSIDPELPAGLTFDTSDGAISGTPTAASAPASYIVTSQNSGGQSTVTLTLEVDSSPLLDLGHAAGIFVLRQSGSSVLSVDTAGHWNLWNYASASEIASGDLYCAQDCSPGNQQFAPNKPIPDHIADMAGGTVVFVTQNQSGFEVRSATTGQILSNISASVSWWSLASDGSYLLAGSQTGLSAWSPSGNSLLSLSGDYSQAIAFAAPGQIRLADGPSGQNVIQTVSVPGGVSTTGPAFNGQFSSWFLGGSRFITTAATTALVYSPNSVQQALITLPSGSPAVGQGNWIWTRSGGTLDVFAITTGSTPAATFTVGPISILTPSAMTIAVTSDGPTASNALSVIDLSGTTPEMANYTLPIVDTDEAVSESFESGYAALSASQWVIGNTWGVLLDGASLGATPRYFDYGAAWSIAGSNGSIAVATASGRIVYFDASTLTQEGVIPFSASQVLLSSDNSVLAAAGDENDNPYGDPSIRIYSLPGASLLFTWPYSFSGTFPVDIALSGSGAVLGQVLFDSTSYTEEAGPSTGGSAIFSSSFNTDTYQSPPPAIRISPDGTNFATSTDLPANATSELSGATNILHNGNPVTTVAGYPAGWLDDGHLLVESSSDCNVYSPTGQSTGPCLLPGVQAINGFTPIQPVTSDTVYGIDTIDFPPPPARDYSYVRVAAILSVSTGSVSWASGDLPLGMVGAAAGNRVVFISQGQVLAQGH